jgi:CopG family nickel-responsive transcriptional regulator
LATQNPAHILRLEQREAESKLPSCTLGLQLVTEITRISISLEAALADAFDRFVGAKGYATRSDAVRDLIRERLVDEELREPAGQQIAVVSLVYDHHAPGVADALLHTQHHSHEMVISTMHVHLGERYCLEVIVLRGAAARLRKLADALTSQSGVLHGKVAFATVAGLFDRLR